MEETLLFSFVLEKKKALLELINTNTNIINFRDKKNIDLKIHVQKSEFEKDNQLLQQQNSKVDKNNNNNKKKESNIAISNGIRNKNTVRNLNISPMNSGFNKVNTNLSEASNTDKISSKYARSSSACMISSSDTIKTQSTTVKAGNINVNNIISSQKNINESSNKLEKFNPSGNNHNNNNNKKAHYSFANNTKQDNSNKINENSNTPVNFQAKFFQSDKQIENTSAGNDCNNNHAEYKNINKFLNMSNHNRNKAFIVNNTVENTDSNKNNNSFLEEDSSYNLKTHSDIKKYKKKIDFEVINDCMKSFLEIEKNINLKLDHDLFISKTPLNNKYTNLDKSFYALKLKKIQEQDINSDLTNDGRQTTRSFTNAQNKKNNNIIDNNSFVDTNKEEKIDGDQNDKERKKSNTPIAGVKDSNSNKKCEFEVFKFNNNYDFDLYNQQDYHLNHHQQHPIRKDTTSNSGSSKSREKSPYSYNDYYDPNAEKPNYEPIINIPNRNVIQDNIANSSKNKNLTLSLQESKIFFLFF